MPASEVHNGAKREKMYESDGESGNISHDDPSNTDVEQIGASTSADEDDCESDEIKEIEEAEEENAEDAVMDAEHEDEDESISQQYLGEPEQEEVEDQEFEYGNGF
ncbi:hypothetical protein LTS18_013197 [Coniosporium uncinatum]|uniref:Uncharacterized protein n=1 Tax=Coniosporium uncinatum TaxID=93489 RepID=A0ACC3D8X2_9PEZI|nr:hypothetical protein LTS18_013197 [Coniosporium uncinatum]